MKKSKSLKSVKTRREVVALGSVAAATGILGGSAGATRAAQRGGIQIASQETPRTPAGAPTPTPAPAPVQRPVVRTPTPTIPRPSGPGVLADVQPAERITDLEINLDQATDEDLYKIRHEVTQRLFERARANIGDPVMYNNHNSVHANHTGEELLPGQEMMPGQQ